MSQPFFSIIIPIYNIDSYLRECIESVLTQDFKNFEIILVNDGSTDKSLQICQEYQLKDSRVKLIDKVNEGLAETRNKGIDISQGEYLIFLDGDDHLEKTGNMLSKIHYLLLNSKIDVLFFNLVGFNLNPDFTYNIHSIRNIKKIGATNNLDIIFRKRVYLASACNKIVKREVIFKNSLRFPKDMLSEDIKWCGDLLKYADNINFYPLNFYFYRQGREGSITFKTSKKNLMDIAWQIRDHYESSIEYSGNKEKYINEFYSFYYLSCIKQMCEHNEFSEKEIISILAPYKSYLTFSLEKRVFFFRIVVKIIGFKFTIKFLRLFLLREKDIEI